MLGFSSLMLQLLQPIITLTGQLVEWEWLYLSVVFMLVIFAMALLLSMPEPNLVVAFIPYLFSIVSRQLIDHPLAYA